MHKTLISIVSILLISIFSYFASAGITDFDTNKYASLVNDYALTVSDNQEEYLDTMIEGTGNKKLGLPANDNYPFNVVLTGASAAQLSTIIALTDSYLVLIDNGFSYLSTMKGYMKSYDSGGIGYLSECVGDITLEFTTNGTTGTGGVYCSNSKFNLKLQDTQIELLRKENLVLKLKTSAMTEFNTRTPVPGEDPWVDEACTPDRVGKFRFNTSKNRVEYCTGTEWLVVVAGLQLCRFDEGYYDNCKF